jgi:GNAT superfamily N-acetyltransferase
MSNSPVLNRTALVRGIWQVLHECDSQFAPDLASLTVRISQPHISIAFGLEHAGYELNFNSVMILQEHVNRVEVEAIAVIPQWRRRGLARELIASIESMKRIVAWVKPYDTHSQAFFNACGFRGNGFYNGQLRYVKG